MRVTDRHQQHARASLTLPMFPSPVQRMASEQWRQQELKQEALDRRLVACESAGLTNAAAVMTAAAAAAAANVQELQPRVQELEREVGEKEGVSACVCA